MSRVRTSVLIATAVFAVSAAAASNVTAAVEQLTRQVYVTVVDNSGGAVTGLTPADFRLRENNRDREINSVEPATEPLRVALMVEETLTPTGGVRQGLVDFIQQMRGKAEMSLTVVGLANRTAVLYTTDVNTLAAGINALPLSQRQQNNHVPEGIGDVARVFVKERVARPVIVMIALDSQQVSNEQPQSVLNLLRDSNAQLHVVSIETSQAAVGSQGTGAMMDAAGRAQVLGDGPRQSGGRQWPVSALTAVPKAMASIANDLLNQYKITYTLPAGADASDRVNITTSRRGITLRAPTRVWNGK